MKVIVNLGTKTLKGYYKNAMCYQVWQACNMYKIYAASVIYGTVNLITIKDRK